MPPKLKRTYAEGNLTDSDVETESNSSSPNRTRVRSETRAEQCLLHLTNMPLRFMHHGCALGQLCVVEDASHTLIGYEVSATFLDRGNSTLISPILLSKGVVYWMRVAWDVPSLNCDSDDECAPEGRVRGVVRVCPARVLHTYVQASTVSTLLTPRAREIVLDMVRNACCDDD